MSDLVKFLRDPRFFAPFAIVLAFEVFLQSGLYARLLEPNSYAANVRHIMRTTEASEVRPNVLILGTSVAYQGVNLPYLNELVKDTGLVVQSAACQGCMVETQYALYRTLGPELPGVRAVLHFGETALAWKARHKLDTANRSMLAQFPRRTTFDILQRLQFDLEPWDYVYYNVRSATYQADLRDFTLAPLTRIKVLTRFERKRRFDYPYVNEYDYSMAVFGAKDLDDCAKKASAPHPELIAQNLTDRHHQNAVFQTCEIARWEAQVPELGGVQWNALFFSRLDQFYDEVYGDQRMVITAFPPYSDLVLHLNEDRRKAVWERELAKIHGERPYRLIDMRRSLDGPLNQTYYYDLLHLNEAGARAWTEQIAKELRPLAPVILGKTN